MIILGIADGADASAALVVNSELVAAVTEEAARRSRHAHGFPSAAVDAVLDVAGLRPRDVDRVVFAGSFTPAAVFRAQPGLRRDPAPGEWARGVQSVLRKTGLYMVDQSAAMGSLEKRLRAQGFTHAFVETMEHDKAHATSIYRTQPRDELLLFTFDSPGDGACLSVWEARNLQMDRSHLQTALASLSTFPARIARILKVLEEDLEWIASPEAPPDLVARLREELHYEGPGFNRQKLRRGPDPLLGLADRGADLASAALVVIEEAVSACVSDYIRRHKMPHIGIAGSVIQPRLAGVLASLPEVESLWVPPMPGDAGLSVGAVLHAAGTATQRLRDPCLGPSWSDDACYRALSNASLPRDKVEDPEEEAAQLLADGKVVARFAGPLEFSYQGLGNRNYLCSSEAGAASRLGETLRMDNAARIGVALRVDEAPEAFPDLEKVQDAVRFGTVALHPSPSFAAQNPGINRQDGRMIPQVVHPEDDPSFYRLLGHYHQRTGRDALACLTLARPGEPVAASPADAIGAWRDSKAEALFLGPYRVLRN